MPAYIARLQVARRGNLPALADTNWLPDWGVFFILYHQLLTGRVSVAVSIIALRALLRVVESILARAAASCQPLAAGQWTVGKPAKGGTEWARRPLI